MKRAEVWDMHVYFYGTDGGTDAHVAVNTPTDVVWGRGTSARRPGDPLVDAIGDELALSRALADLSVQLLARAELDRAAAETPARPTPSS